MRTPLLIALALAALGARPAAAADRPPNIVFILADDLGINDLSCYGRKDPPTPRLDRLAAEGARFTSAYAAQSVCSPTRAALMTGKAPARLHLTTFLPGRPDTPAQLLLHPTIEQQLPAGEKTLADGLKAAGYTSACLGKWHLGGKGSLPTDRGFDEAYAGKANTEPTAGEGGKGEFDLTGRAEKFLDANKDRPFFLYLAHNNPHVPLAARPELVKKHADAFNPVYAAMVETLDASVGRVLDRLETLGLAENTLVVFTSDNGGLHVPEGKSTPATHNTPFRAGKGFLYEGGIRVPLIVRWPGKVKAGTTIDTPVVTTDWHPTLLAAAGAKAEGGPDGVGLLGLLTKGEPPAARPLFWHQPHYTNQGGQPSSAIRQGDWKLIEHTEDGRLELFDLAKDPGETADLAAKEPARVAELRGKLEKWRRDVKAQGNLANPTFNPTPWAKLYRDTDASRLPAGKTAAAGAEKLADWRALMNAVVPKANAEPPAGAGPGRGAVILHARDATVRGEKLRYEPEPHKDTLGFWVRAEDRAEWEFEVPAVGAYTVEVLQGCGKGSGGAEVELSAAGQAVTFTVEETGHFQRFVPKSVGTLNFEKAGKHTLSVRAKSKPGPAVMDLRRVTLKAAP